jgi:hypothetical protein
VRAQAPTHRPTWVLVLSSLMLVTSGSSLASGLMRVQDPATALRMDSTNVNNSEAELQLNQRLAAVRTATVSAHRRALRLDGMAEIALSLFGLYATAAVLARDRHGRRLALAVGALVIVYRLGSLPVYLALTRDYAERGAELMTEALLQNPAFHTDLSSADLTLGLKATMVNLPIAVAAVCIAGAVILMAYFGGKRGRALYGISAPPGPPPRDLS